jgi:hypothetical protein
MMKLICKIKKMGAFFRFSENQDFSKNFRYRKLEIGKFTTILPVTPPGVGVFSDFVTKIFWGHDKHRGR